LTASSPARVVALYEVFIAACNLKAEEIDDSDGYFGTFAGSLFCGWIQARQAADADPGATTEILPFSIGRVRSGLASLQQVQIEFSAFVVKYAAQRPHTLGKQIDNPVHTLYVRSYADVTLHR